MKIPDDVAVVYNVPRTSFYSYHFDTGAYTIYISERDNPAEIIPRALAAIEKDREAMKEVRA